jgi:hypothetical protein
MLINEIVVEATGDEKFDRMLKNIATPPKPSIFKRIRGFFTPDVDRTAREHYESMATSWGRVANHFYELYKQLPKDHPRYQITKSKWEYAMGHRVLYDMLSGRRNYDEQLARMIQQRYKIDPRDKLPSI